MLTALDERIIAIGLGTLVLTHAALTLTHPPARLSPASARLTAPPVGLAAGALQGATGLSGAVLAVYLQALRLTPAAFVLSISALFGLFGLAQAVGLAVLVASALKLLLDIFL